MPSQCRSRPERCGTVRRMADAEPTTDRTSTFYWVCAVLCLVIGLFLAADISKSNSQYGATAWIGVTLAAVLMLALTALYVACATGRLALRRVLVGTLTLFHLSTICVVVAVGADILIPARDTGSLALLLPWGITYWLYNLRPAEPTP
jgi:FtsH-binding integral membrane protein